MTAPTLSPTNSPIANSAPPAATTIVMKFGGTSMKDAATIEHSAKLAHSSLAAMNNPAMHAVVVVSAMDQVTELLLELGDAAAHDNRAALHALMAELRLKHETAARTIGNGAADAVASLLDKLDRLVAGIAAVGELTSRSKDAVVSFGERLSAAMMGAAMGCRVFSGSEAGIVTNDTFGRAEPLMDLSLFQIKQNIGAVLARNEHCVVTGFIAATQHGVTTTLGRGGSDYTASILGAALQAKEIWIWSDVDGLMTADPRIVPSAKLLETMTFAEAIEMGQFGAKSMHPLALEPAAEHAIPVRFRNTFNSTGAGTLILPQAPGMSVSSADGGDDHPVKSIPQLKNAALINISGAAMIGRPGTAAQVFRSLAEAAVNIMMISQSVSEAGISLVVAKDHSARAKAVLERTLMRTGVARAVSVMDDVHVVAVVGAGMAGHPGVAARVFNAVAREKINVVAIAQGSSELSISFVVKQDQSSAAVRALHAEFMD